MSYFNTTNESGATLKNNVAKAKSQEELVFNCIKKHIEYYSGFAKGENKKGITASEILDYFPNYPITSIRRSLTMLTFRKKLIKTNEKRIGMYGRSEYVWKLNENN